MRTSTAAPAFGAPNIRSTIQGPVTMRTSELPSSLQGRNPYDDSIMSLLGKYDPNRSIPVPSPAQSSTSLGLHQNTQLAASSPPRTIISRTQPHQQHILHKPHLGPNPSSSLNPSTNANSNGQQFAHLRAPTAPVFDPNDFPSLAGGASASTLPGSASAVSATTTIAQPNGGEPTSASMPTMSLAQTVNGMTSYHDLLSGGAYASHRTKQDTSLTTSAPGEFSMHNEDFPALGGQAHVESSMPTDDPSSVIRMGAALGINPRASEKTDSTFDHHNVFAPQGINRPAASIVPTSSTQPLVNGESESSTSTAFPQTSVPAALMSSSTALFPPGRSTQQGGTSLDTGNLVQAPLLQGPPVNSMLDGVKDGRPTLWTANSSIPGIPVAKSCSPAVGKDAYGVRSLLPLVSAQSEGTGENVLAVGLDLTNLGLDFNSPEPLYKTFNNPWEGGQYAMGDRFGEVSQSNVNRVKEQSFKLPTCYYMQPPGLRSSHFSKFHLETLFYIFYNMPRDVLQLLAAVELYGRNWRYHKGLKLWFSCDAQMLQSYDRGGYVYFDIKVWERRPFPDANQSFIQGFMTEDELHAVSIPSL